MKYMLLMYFDENGALTQEQREHCYVESAAFAQKLHESGQFLGASPLQPTSTATSLRQQNGKRLVTDGPFAETREQLGGFFLIDARDLDEAIAAWKEAIRLKPQLAGAHRLRGDVCTKEGNLDRAIASYSEAIRLDPRSVASYRGRAEAHSRKGERDRAEADRREAERLKSSMAR